MRRSWRFEWVYLGAGILLAGLIPLMIVAGTFFAVMWMRGPALSGTLADQAWNNAPLTPGLIAGPTLSPPPTTIPSTAVPTASPVPTYHCTESRGQVLEKAFSSSVAQDRVPYRIYLPPCYAQIDRRYPYAILLHGVGSDETEWTDTLGVNHILDSDIANGLLPPMILVMPKGGMLEYNNVFVDGASFDSFIVHDLIPEVETNYCTLSTPAGRALAGISRGGFWVFEIGFRHPDLFGILAGHSAYFDPTNAPPSENPLDLAQTVTFASGTAPRVWLDVAADDPDTRQGIDAFVQTLTARRLNPAYTVYPSGGHEPAYWQSHLQQYLAFYGQNWQRNPLLLPVCKQ
jgi:enterochelin esterase-like enzyme